MSGITDIETLLTSMKPKHIAGEFIFCSLSENEMSTLSFVPLFIFREAEGVTMITTKEYADKNDIHYEHVWSLITLTVHSSLTAVWFLAAITTKLAQSGISVNAISAYYHDHIFVPIERTQEALELLQTFTL